MVCVTNINDKGEVEFCTDKGQFCYCKQERELKMMSWKCECGVINFLPKESICQCGRKPPKRYKIIK